MDDECHRRLAQQPQHPLWNVVPVTPSLPPLVAEVPVQGVEDASSWQQADWTGLYSSTFSALLVYELYLVD